jgi:hypothetical protein
MAMPLSRISYDHVQFIAVDSSNIQAIGYDRKFSRLFVKFLGGSIYAYDRVESSVWDGFQRADSKGNYLYRVIRSNGTDSMYAYHKLA